MPEIRVVVPKAGKQLKEKIGDSWPQLLDAGLQQRAKETGNMDAYRKYVQENFDPKE